MKKKPQIPPRDQIKDDTPLRLAVAAAIAYPDGSMTAHGLRSEARRGRLTIERTAGRDYTTLAAIADMRKLCRVPQTVGASECGQAMPTPAVNIARPGPLRTEDFQSALSSLKTNLSKRSRSTSPKSTLEGRKLRRERVVAAE